MYLSCSGYYSWNSKTERQSNFSFKYLWKILSHFSVISFCKCENSFTFLQCLLAWVHSILSLWMKCLWTPHQKESHTPHPNTLSYKNVIKVNWKIAKRQHYGRPCGLQECSSQWLARILPPLKLQWAIASLREEDIPSLAPLEFLQMG